MAYTCLIDEDRRRDYDKNYQKTPLQPAYYFEIDKDEFEIINERQARDKIKRDEDRDKFIKDKRKKERQEQGEDAYFGNEEFYEAWKNRTGKSAEKEE